MPLCLRGFLILEEKIQLVEDKNSMTGYDTQFGPLPEWEALHKWQLRTTTESQRN